MDLKEEEDIKKRWQEYTEDLYVKKDLNNPDNHDGVITHLEWDILQCELKLVLLKWETKFLFAGQKNELHKHTNLTVASK